MADDSSPPRKKQRDEGDLQFDLCPRTINVAEFVEARALEITQILSVVDNASLPIGEVAQGPRTFVQRLPRHMRRRAMSYNIKRLPRRIRSMAESTIKESKHRKKPPSRRWRRRPRNLLNAYIRRQRRSQWLETHIWHAKRFHMVDFCGWRLPDRSCQRGFRASYRDAVRHCLVQDISFNICLELEGPEELLVDRLNVLCHKTVSQTFSNSKVLSGGYEGRAILYESGTYPLGCLGTIRFMYRPKIGEERDRTLWIWSHPALETRLVEILVQLLNLDKSVAEAEETDLDKSREKRFEEISQYHLSKLFSPATYRSSNGKTTLRVLKHHLARFRLTGPKSGIILSKVLHQPSQLNSSSSFNNEITTSQVDAQWNAWKNIYSRVDVGRVDSGQIVSLITMDPRLFTEYKKKLPADMVPYLETLPSSDLDWVKSPLWSPDSRRFCLETKMSDHELNKLRQKINRTAGNVLEAMNEKANLVPIMLIQQPSSNVGGHIGKGAGWDIVIPGGWAMPFWIALQYATARAVGLDFPKHFSMETADQTLGYPYFWPDTGTGQMVARKEDEELTARYFRKPINRRVDFERLRITHPFMSPWKDLIDGWIRATGNKDLQSGAFFVLRDRIALRKVEQAFQGRKSKSVQNPIDGLCLQYPRALVAIRLTSIGKGVPKHRALICLPTRDDLAKLKSQRSLNELEFSTMPKPKVSMESEKQMVVEEAEFISLTCGRREVELDLGSFFEDKKEKRLIERKRKEKERKKAKKRQQTNGGTKEKEEDGLKVAVCDNVIDSCQRRILGYVVNGDYSFGNGRGQAIGFCSLLALNELKEFLLRENTDGCFVLYRNTQSKYYRAAVLSLLT